MKKLAVLAVALLTVLSLVLTVSAKQDAFTTIAFDSTTADSIVELWDDPDTKSQGGSGNEIQKMDDYGVGYSSLNDQVIFHDVDFGDNGANVMHIFFSQASDNITTLDIHLDTIDNDPIAQFEIGNTGGWSKDFAQDFAADVEIPGGVYDVIVEFTNSNSGSFAKISFEEAPEVVIEVEDEAESAAEAEAVAAPKTADLSVIAVLAAAAAGFVLSKKH